ncbi:MAG: GNAT family N-acetyltransferase [Desulfuromonas sp.]|nr:GNAT family N-acetyltransferase [Desulfuromonas sp.]
MIAPLQEQHWPLFLHLAQQEGWRISAVESRLYRADSPHPFLCLHQDGELCGFISGVRHEHEAWIGNLIVAVKQRGKGYGAQLFDALVAHLRQHGCTSLWLTASAAGQPLYEKRGFVANDRIQRWIAPGLGTQPRQQQQGNFLYHCDRAQHHQDRRQFLRSISHNAHVVRYANNVALLQPSTNLTLLGPWYEQGHQQEAEYQFLLQARRTSARHLPVVADVYASAQLQGVLSAAGFRCCSNTTLMHYTSAGSKRIEPGLQRSLAGLGSFN